MDSSEEDDVQQIRVSLILSKACVDTSLEVPSDPIAVPATTRKKGLSAIVNHLLNRKVIRDESASSDDEMDDNEDDDDDEDKLPSLPFDFLLNNKLLRLSVESAARKEGLSLEKPVEIYYFPARLAPESDGESESFPDWISALSHTGNSLFSGSCDGSIHTFYHCSGSEGEKDDFRLSDTIKAHSGPIKCISSIGWSNDLVMVASGSMDQTLVTHCHEKSASGKNKPGLALHAVYSGGHRSSVNSVALNSSKGEKNSLLMASGDWDGGLCVWKVPERGSNNDENDNSTHKRKKQRSSKVSSDDANDVKEVSPTFFYKAHRSNISGIAWAYNSGDNDDASTLFTSSWDHSIKAWDIESQNEILSLNGSKVVTSIGRCHNSDVVATGHPDCCVRLWDMRTSGNGDGNVFDGTLRPR